MADLGRRYWASLQTADGRRKVVGAIVGVAALLAVLASLLEPKSQSAHLAGIFYAVGAGLLGVALVFLASNRRRA